MDLGISNRRKSIVDLLEKQRSVEKKARRGAREYFHGPRDITRHSKWPRALRMNGSVTPKIAFRVIAIIIWSTVVTAIAMKTNTINVNPIIITVLGLIVGFAINFRSATAYERYMEGRKCWSNLNIVSNSLARHVWIHVEERKGERGKSDLLAKVSFLNLLIAFAVALKHKLRFEPYIQYDDLYELVSHLDTFAKHAGRPAPPPGEHNLGRQFADLLHLASKNPRAELKRAKRPVGNLPLEILSYMMTYLKGVVDNGTLTEVNMGSKVMNDIRTLDDILVTSDRILNTPLPIAYNIAIAQITWIYLLTLPFQLVHLMDWLTVPVCTIAAYMVFGFAEIGNHIENPFGLEVNDLPLETYCAQIASDISIISSKPPPDFEDYVLHPDNKPLYPISSADSKFWPRASMADIRDALTTRAMLSKPAMWRKQSFAITGNTHKSFASTGASTLYSSSSGGGKTGVGKTEREI